MATSDLHDYDEKGESDTEACDSDDSQEDPTFNIEETQSRFSNLSIKKKSKSRILKETDEDTEGDPDVVEMIVPELDEKDQKSFETVQKIIEVGQVEKLKVDQCKVYLRKHGLRLTGNKDTLLERIREYLDIVKSGGEMRYPASSFVVNCKGDACTGDVVMFEQNVYEMFNIASRSASGPPCGTRVVAGRIVKESYGAAKQQHTFTVEVLWSKGEKPLPPLHPLLIKGRNLYRLKTMRQRWKDEAERQKKLMEKHTRGSVARSNREARIQEKEMRKMLKPNRVSRIGNQNGGKRKTSQSLPPISLGNPVRQFDEPKEQKTYQEEDFQQKECQFSKPTFFPCANVPLVVHQRQPLTSMNCNPHGYEQNINSNPHGYEQNINSNPTIFPNANVPLERYQKQFLTSVNCNPVYKQKINSNPSKSPLRRRPAHEENVNCNSARSPFRGHGHEQKKQLCRYYAQGRCYYGDHCKYLHENTVNQNHVQRKNGWLAF